MFQSIALEFENREEMEKAASLLWNKYDVSGELELMPLDTGRFRLTIHSEKQLRDTVLERLPGKRVQAKSILREAKKELPTDVAD